MINGIVDLKFLTIDPQVFRDMFSLSLSIINLALILNSFPEFEGLILKEHDTDYYLKDQLRLAVSHLHGFIHPRWWSPDFWTINIFAAENRPKIPKRKGEFVFQVSIFRAEIVSFRE